MITENCVDCFKALSIPARANIYMLLEQTGPLSVTKVVEKFNLTQPTVSYHLKSMENSGILVSKKQGRQVLYNVNENCPHNTVACFLNHEPQNK